MGNTASSRHIRRLLGGAIPQDAVAGLEEALAAVEGGAVASVDGQTGEVDLSDIYVPSAGGTMSGPLVLPGDAGTALAAVPKQQLDAAIAGATIADATTLVKGKLQLAGDLGGTAALPTVPGLAAKADDAAVLHLGGAEERITVAKDFHLNRSAFKPVDPRARHWRGAVPVAVIGSSVTHTLAEYYASLGAAQVDFPLATSLAQNVDAVIINQTINALPMGLYSGGEILLRDGIYVCGSTPLRCEPPPLGASPTTDQKRNRRITFGGDSMATRITFAGTNGPGLQFLNCSRSIVHDLWLTAGGGITNLLHVSVMDPDGSLGYGIRTCQNFTIENMYLDGSTNGVTNSYVGIGTDTNYDVSEIVLRSVFVSGGGGTGGTNDYAAFTCGQGGTGNVLDISSYGCKAASVQYGIIINGGDWHAYGFHTQFCSQYVYWFKVGGRSSVIIDGGRDENSGGLIRHSFGSSAPAVATVRNVHSHSMINSTGIGVLVESLGVLNLEDGGLEGLTHPQGIRVSAGVGSSAFPTNVNVKNFAFQGDLPLVSSMETGTMVRNVQGVVSGGPNISPQLLKANTAARQALQKYYNPATVAFDAASASVHEVYLRQNVTATTVTNMKPGQEISIVWVQDGTGSRTYAWPTTCAFVGGVAPTASTTAKRRDLVKFVWDGRYLVEVLRSLDIAPPTIPAVTVTDAFTRDTSTSYRIGTSTSGHVPEVTQGEAKCNGTKLVPLVLTGTAGIMRFAAVWETGRSDGTFQVDVTHGAGADGGLILRQAEADRYIVVYINDTQTSIRKRQGTDTQTAIGTATRAHTAGVTYTLQVVFSGATVTIREDGVIVMGPFAISADDQLEYGTNTKAGIFCGLATTSTFDNFSAGA